MKTLKLLLTSLLLLFISINLHAEYVPIEKATKVATNFMAQKHTYVTKSGKVLRMYKSLELINISTKSLNFDNFYIFNLNDNQGWVIVSGDDSVTPILGYSTNGNFNIDNIGPNTRELLDSYNKQIQYAIDNKKTPNADIQEQWKELLSRGNRRFVNRSDDKQVYPLIQTQWNQYPYYNDYCPYDYDYDELTVTGCAATAMAQIMNYWEYPEKGVGFHSYNHEKYGTLSANFGATYYDWDNMPNTLNYSSSYEQIEAVATLMYHCGVSVDMNYGVAETGGSGAGLISRGDASAPCAENALKSFFDYNNSLQGIFIGDYIYECDSEEEFLEGWINMLKNELDNDRPILYAGFGLDENNKPQGHAFICDGYDNNDYFHINWGWGGSNDGHYNIMNHNYSHNQYAFIGIEPNDMSQHNFDLQLYSDIYMEDEIWFGSEIELYADIANMGNATFEGYMCAAVFDEDGNFVDYIQIGEGELQGGYYNEAYFYNEGNMAFVPGLYQVMLFYGTQLGNWIRIDDGDYLNYAMFEVYYSSDIEVNSNFTILSDNGTLENGSMATINVDVLNTDYDTFYGDVRLALSNIDGSYVQTIQEIEIELPYNYHFTGGLTFDGIIAAEPGTYYLSVNYREEGSNSWYYAGASDYPNPISVIVEAQDISSDSYESNNTQNTAYNLNVSWNNNQSTINTVNANLHIGNDVDYYKITLQDGYNYEITARLFDEYTHEINYTVDAMFSYSIDGGDYSEPYDDEMDNNITLNEGATIYFAVSPYFSGMTGSYKLQIEIDRVSTETAPDAPENLVANPLSTSSIILTWNPVNNATAYKVYRDGTFLTNVSNTNYTDNDLEYDTEYCYMVTAIKNNLESDKSDEACVNTLGEGIAEFGSSLKLYPNPIDNYLFIEDDVEIEELTIVNILGVVIFRESNFYEKIIDFSNYNSGTYIIKIKNKKGETYRRIIKN